MTPVNVSGAEAMNLRGGMERLSVVLAAVVGVIGLGCLAIIAFDPNRGGWPWFLAGLGAAGGAAAIALGKDPQWARWRTTYILAAPWLLVVCFAVLGSLQAQAAPSAATHESAPFWLVGGVCLYCALLLTAQGVILLLRFLADGFRQTPTR